MKETNEQYLDRRTNYNRSFFRLCEALYVLPLNASVLFWDSVQSSYLKKRIFLLLFFCLSTMELIRSKFEYLILSLQFQFFKSSFILKIVIHFYRCSALYIE